MNIFPLTVYILAREEKSSTLESYKPCGRNNKNRLKGESVLGVVNRLLCNWGQRQSLIVTYIFILEKSILGEKKVAEDRR